MIDVKHILIRYAQSIAQHYGLTTATEQVLWDEAQHFKQNPFTKEEEEWLRDNIFPQVFADSTGRPASEYNKDDLA